MASPRPPLGGLSAKVFLRDYWQQRPLLVRQAVPGFSGVLDRQALFALACSEDAESRLIQRRARDSAWHVTQGPLRRRDFSSLAARNWTLLVNGVNLHSRDADALLQRFAFVPWSRLDDVMVSYAVDGGGVGPHADSYDVFLLQGPGRRRWRLMPPPAPSRGYDMVADAPLKLIANFRPIDEMTLDPGDMLYVPPGWGHEGTALGTCHTYSVGFRAPGGVELSTAFLDFLHERGFADAAYADAGRAPARHPARLDAHIIDHATKVLGNIRWQRADVAEFLGRYLSEPKQHVVFSPPARPLTRAAFLARLVQSTIRLDPRSRLLAGGAQFYLNGVSVAARGVTRAALLELGDRRRIDGNRLAREPDLDLIFEWYRQGYLDLERHR